MTEYRSFLKIPSPEISLDNGSRTRSMLQDSETESDYAENESNCFPNVNQGLLQSKLFYFCYSSAMGSLWPYLPLYFRQLFLTPRQVGAIVASRNFVQFLFVPLWCVLAEKYRRHKTFLLVALFAWFVCTVGILFVPKERPQACKNMNNTENKSSYRNPYKWFDFSMLNDHKVFILNRRSYENEISEDIKSHYEDSEEVSDDYYSPTTIFNVTSDMDSIYAEYDPERHLADNSRPFILLFIITVLGVSLASPAQVLADIYTLKKLKHQDQSFGQQALWAAIGSALFTFLVGTFVSFCTKINPCTKQIDINYTPCFYAFAVFILLAFLSASRFNYGALGDNDSIDLDETIATFWECVRTINDVHLASLSIVTFYCGFGNGFISTFLFWHLREMGGLQILLALVSLLNSTAEVLFYIISERLMGCVGRFRLIYLGLFFFSARFFYYSFLRQPWLVLPIEITHGMTSAAIRSALISYIRQEGAAGYILHGLFNGIHSGLGFSIGGLIGGLMVHEYGHSITFLIFGEVSLLTLLCFILVNNIWPLTKHEVNELKIKNASNKKTLADLYNVYGGVPGCRKVHTSFNKYISIHALCSEKKTDK